MFAIKFESGFLAIQGREVWYQHEPTGWTVSSNDENYLNRVARQSGNGKKFEILEI